MNKAILIIFLIITNLSIGQNLVPNPSFEIKTACPNILSFIHYASGWERYCAETPDYYNACVLEISLAFLIIMEDIKMLQQVVLMLVLQLTIKVESITEI